MEIYLHISKPIGDISSRQSEDGFQLSDRPNEYLYTYCIVIVSSIPCLKMIRTKQAGNSQNPTASVDANEEVIDEALRGKQGHLPLAPMIKITWETTFRDTSVNQSTITYDDDHGVDLSAHWLLENYVGARYSNRKKENSPR